MNTICRVLLAAVVTLTFPSFGAVTEGEATLQVTLLDYSGTSGTRHWTVVWVTTGSGTFVKTLRKQGPSMTASHWGSHCREWYNAKGSNNALDGYSSATASNYTGTNSPVILTWDGRDASNNLMPDGDYKFWVQYAEDSGQGPFTTSGLLWTKGGAKVTKAFPNQGSNFASMKVEWIPVVSTPPVISSARIEGSNMVITGSGTPNGQFRLLSTSDPSQPTGAWNVISTNTFGPDGAFTISVGIPPASLQGYYRVGSL